jgi:nucleoside-diphosphate-sugar epimerase
MSRALVTGATGQVGHHIVERLLADGWDVRALSRSAQAREALPGGVDVQLGDVLDEASLHRAAAGCNVVFHAAANIIVRGGWDAYRVTNIEGTRNVISACERSDARLLQVSSVAVYGSSRYSGTAAKTSEDSPLGHLSDRAFYARSKRESEALVMQAHQEGRIWATAVRPDVIYGRYDRQYVPRVGRLLDAIGVVPLFRGGRSTMPIVHAANVADGAVLAATNDRAGGRAYNLANDHDVTVRRFFELAGVGLGRRVRFVPMSVGIAGGLMRGARVLLRTISAGTLSFSMAGLSFLSEDNPFTSDRAKNELGWRPSVHPDDGIPDAFRWWRERRREGRRK